MVSIRTENLSLLLPVVNKRKGKVNKSKVGGRLVDVNGRLHVQALDNISFELNKGDRLGLVGHNGSGKSTLLRVLAGIYPGYDGQIQINGKLGHALNIRLGFRPEATCRRNIELKCIMFDVPRHEYKRIEKDVLEFTGLGPYIDQPINTFSDGMLTRLAFGLATSIKYQILLLDEWIGAGDQAFREAAQTRMESFASAEIVILASHNRKLIDEWCNKIIELEHGTIKDFTNNK